jgi:hypothetical protein
MASAMQTFLFMPQQHGLLHVAQQIMLHHQAELEAAKKIMESISGQVTFILSSQNIFHLLSPEFSRSK